MNNRYCLIFLWVCLIFSLETSAQEVDLENLGTKIKSTLKKNPFRISGSASANTIFYNSNVNSNRDDFNYFLNGNLNVGIYSWSLPISYSLTNQGSKLGYEVPFKFNRLSISPKYKWIRAHLGDASMNFSPYTLNGLMFTGAGLELTPDMPLKVSVMTGRLNKAVEDNGDPRTIPAYKRTGHGAHLKWEEERYKIGLIGFYAKDDLGSLRVAPDIKGVTPQENLVLSFTGNVNIYKNLAAYFEYANTAITNDVRTIGKIDKKGVASALLKGNSSTEMYDAVNGGIDLKLKKGMLGIRYERIDPGYRTLGAYYFNNDLENITLNTAFNLFKDRVSLATNIGKQRDNLDQQKLKQSSRWVGSINTNIKASDKLMVTANYSNFTMFTNNQLNQFTNINENPLLVQQPIDSIDYKQISQNLNVNANYILSSSKELTQNLNVNYSLNDMVNKENDIVRVGGISRFHNVNLAYALGFPDRKLNIATSFSYTNSFAASSTSTIFGPAFTVNKSFLKDKLSSTLGVSYNRSSGSKVDINVTNFRLGCNYNFWKKHSFNANIIQMFRNTNQQSQNPKLNEMTASFGYNYSL